MLAPQGSICSTLFAVALVGLRTLVIFINIGGTTLCIAEGAVCVPHFSLPPGAWTVRETDAIMPTYSAVSFCRSFRDFTPFPCQVEVNCEVCGWRAPLCSTLHTPRDTLRMHVKVPGF
ncbi:hypothetical protein TRVL_07535 [Trypanosoma vivax]|nr:hypothetical protein TRVL_07535 [Trypanosoma vivax]